MSAVHDSQPTDMIPPLQPGDRLTRDEFERRHDAMTGWKKADLIEGVVRFPERIPQPGHSSPRLHLATWLGLYSTWTPGTTGGIDSSIRLDPVNELQPDVLLLIDPTLGGQSRIGADDIIEQAPELVADVSASSASFDLHTKKTVYQRNGVREYLVWRVLDERLDWFVLRAGEFQPLVAVEGVLRSDVFPGLWLDADALIRGDMTRVMAVVQEGLASAEHAAFVQRLQMPPAQRRTVLPLAASPSRREAASGDDGCRGTGSARWS